MVKKEKKIISCKYCGGNPKIEESAHSHYYPPIKYIAKCNKCEARTEDGDTPEEAISNWNAQLFTHESEMLSRPLKAENVYADGVIRMAEAVFRNASEHYMEACRDYNEDPTEKNRKRRDNAEVFFYKSPFMGAIDAEPKAIIKALRKRALHE